jgi:hypothetical protein
MGVMDGGGVREMMRIGVNDESCVACTCCGLADHAYTPPAIRQIKVFPIQMPAINPLSCLCFI